MSEAPKLWNNLDVVAGFAGPLTSGAQLAAAIARAEKAEAELNAMRVVPSEARNEILQSDNHSLRQQVLNLQEHFDAQKARADRAEALLQEAVDALRFYAPTVADGIRFQHGDDEGKRAAAFLAKIEAANA